MPSLAESLPPFPGFALPKTRAAWPVWKDSTTETIRFQPGVTTRSVQNRTLSRKASEISVLQIRRFVRPDDLRAANPPQCCSWYRSRAARWSPKPVTVRF